MTQCTERNKYFVCVCVCVSVLVALMPHRQTDVSSSSPSGSGVIFLPSGTASQSARPTTSQYHTHTLHKLEHTCRLEHILRSLSFEMKH